MTEFSKWFKDLSVGCFFLCLVFLIGGVVHWPEFYGNVVGEFVQAVNETKVEK